VLPDWPEGTVTILVTAGETPHAIPVSAAVRAGPRRALLGLAAARGSLKRLRQSAGVALLIMCEGTTVTAHGQARVVEEELTDGTVAVAIDVECVQDHDRPTFEILGGVTWRWTDAEAEARDREVRAALRSLAERLPG
jgi:hypothetical protein